jgi:hypothetical protein
MLRRCLSGLLLVLLLLPAPLGAQANPPDQAAYVGWLRESLVAAERRDHLGLRAAAAELIATEAIRSADGTVVPVDNRWLAEALAVPEPDFAYIATRLAATLDAFARPPSIAASVAQQQLSTILNNPPFAEAERGNLLLALLDWFFSLLDRLLAPIDSIGPGPRNLLGWIVAGLGGLLVAAVLIYWLRGLGATMRQEAHAAVDDPAAGLSARQALQQADERAVGGDYRSGVRYLYLAALLQLDERGLLRYDRALTNREYLLKLEVNPQLRERLQPIVETFDRVWYGYVPLDAEGFAAYRNQVEALKR